MFVITSNAKEVFASISRILRGMPAAVATQEPEMQRVISEGVDDHFQQLGLGGSYAVLQGTNVQWELLRSGTEEVRLQRIEAGVAASGVGASTPILELTGAMRTAGKNGVAVSQVTPFAGQLSYIPAGEDHKFEIHDEGGEGDIGYIPARPVLFWDPEMANGIIEATIRHFNILARKEGFV